MSTISKFPLFKLPWLAIKEVISNMEFATLVVSNGFITFTTGELRKSVEPGIKYLTQLFSCPLPRIYIYPNGMKKPILPSLVGCGDYCKDIMIRGKEEIENEELHKILQKFTFKRTITFEIPSNEDFTSDIRLWKHPNKIYIQRYAHWVTREMLFGVNCSYMAFGGCKQLKAIDCRLFVDRWMNSNDLGFHFLEIRWKLSDYPEELNYDYFGGLELQEFDPKSRGYAYCQCDGWAMDVSMGRDFKRKDGLLATIKLVNKCFIFCVWHERFPNLEGRTVVPY
ncbi:unnamed protein product [Caenorhabditis brenneri]